MAIFDDVVVNAKSAAAAVSKKAGAFYDLSKLRISCAGLRGELTKKYQALGESVFNNDPAETIDVLKDEIADLKQDIADIERTIAASSNTVFCPKCGEKLSKSARYCSTCGARVVKNEEPVAEEAPASESAPETASEETAE